MEQENHRGQWSPEWPLCQDQTQLVAVLLRIDRWAGEDERIAIVELDELSEPNSFAYVVKQDDKEIALPETLYFAQIEEWNQRQEMLMARLKGYWPQEEREVTERELAELKASIDVYEEARAFRRRIFSWWAIPYWLGEALVKKGEAVLRGYGCTWWGTTDPVTAHPSMSEVIKAIVNDLHSLHPNTATQC
ncbi:hypothetical protein [uncultured Chitinophaga sp.]|jgi:hypothetical protein|uniref:hypothetical protein n=1 Tax=uncultured Chitinophaga sp. TaxID=339340 RepID=UPI00261BC686|nr:hypothetical protein [uncultured Chitinophaga sp.]